MGEDVGTGRDRRVYCAMCGAATEGPPPTWTMQVGRRGAEWVCGRCTRENVRSIEGRLDREWW